ncbi:MAG: NfeD family protein [Pseudomonadota bacterium]
MLELLNPTCGHFWLSLGLVLAILEMVLPGFVFLSLGLGALLPAVLAYLGLDSLVWLLSAYAGFSVITLFSIRTILGQRVFGTKKHQETNVMGLIGTHGLVTSRIGNIHEPGYVKLQGEDWRAVSKGACIETGVCVEVKSISGATVTVEPVGPTVDCKD